MKHLIDDNGIIREMTLEEIAEMERLQAKMPKPEPTELEKLQAKLDYLSMMTGVEL